MITITDTAEIDVLLDSVKENEIITVKMIGHNIGTEKIEGFSHILGQAGHYAHLVKQKPGHRKSGCTRKQFLSAMRKTLEEYIPQGISFALFETLTCTV